MNIIYLSNSSIPSRTANSVHVIKMCNAFIKNGHNLMLFSRKGHKSCKKISEWYNIKFDIKLIFSSYPKPPILNHLIYTLIVRNKVFSLPKPDLLYARHAYSLYLLKELGSNLIYEAHDTPDNIIQKWMLSKLFKHKKFKRLVVISSALKEEYSKIFPNLEKTKIYVAPDAADEITMHKQLSMPTWPTYRNTLQIGYVGHLYPGKGMEIIIQLADRAPNFDFHIVGGTEQDILKWSKSTNSKNIFFHGFQSQDYLSFYFSKFDIVLAPYQKQVSTSSGKKDISAWMSPLKIFEYMSAKKPIICSDLPVLREILKNLETALLVSPDDVNTWITAINRLNEDRKLREVLAANAYSSFLKKYTWKERARNVLIL